MHTKTTDDAIHVARIVVLQAVGCPHVHSCYKSIKIDARLVLWYDVITSMLLLR